MTFKLDGDLFEMPGGTELTPAGWTCLKELGRGVEFERHRRHLSK